MLRYGQHQQLFKIEGYFDFNIDNKFKQTSVVIPVNELKQRFQHQFSLNVQPDMNKISSMLYLEPNSAKIKDHPLLLDKSSSFMLNDDDLMTSLTHKSNMSKKSNKKEDLTPLMNTTQFNMNDKLVGIPEKDEYTQISKDLMQKPQHNQQKVAKKKNNFLPYDINKIKMLSKKKVLDYASPALPSLNNKDSLKKQSVKNYEYIDEIASPLMKSFVKNRQDSTLNK